MKQRQYTNSELASVIMLSPHCSKPRNHKIDTITIHCAVTNCTAERLGKVFQGTRQVSSNYGVGYDGSIGLYVEECNRSWCSSNRANDNRAITIEVASENKHPYKVTDRAYKALIELLVDICERNGIKELKWQSNKNLIGNIEQQNMTVHRWFTAKACPGDFLYNKHYEIAELVNQKLNNNHTITIAIKPTETAQNGTETIKPIHNTNKPNTELKNEDFGVETLRFSSEFNSYVVQLQSMLNLFGFSCGNVDGYYGNKTVKAVKAFQRANNLKVDGITGEQTKKALLAKLANIGKAYKERMEQKANNN